MQSTRPSIKRITILAFAITGLVVLPLAWSWWTSDQTENSKTSFGRAFNGPYQVADYELEFERTPCFGECPVFKLRIRKDGFASLYVPSDRPFDGTVRTPHIEDVRYSKKLTHEVRLDLASSAERGGFWKMHSEYSYPVTDMPGQRISVSSRDRSWDVHVYAVPCVTQHRNLKAGYMKEWKFERLVPDVFCDLEKKLDAVACDVYLNGKRSGDSGTVAIWPPRCDVNA